MFCPECGTNNTDNSQFCINCGYSLSEVRNVRTESKTLDTQPYVNYQNPFYDAPKESHRTYSPILDTLEDANTSDYRDQQSIFYYLISFFLLPVGIIIWALNKQKKPESSKNILVTSIAGFLVVVLLLTL